MIKNKRIVFGLFVAAFLLFWNLLDLLYNTLVAGSSYQFTTGVDLVSPLAVAIVIGYLLFLRKKGE